MAPRRKVIPVTLSSEQREKLERLWFCYGNHGPQTTPGNHAFIQGLLEHGIDIRPLKQRGFMPTLECERAVKAVLSGEETSSEENSEPPMAHKFRLISTPALQNPIKVSEEKDSELKELIRELVRKSDRNKSRSNREDDLPPAA